MKMLAELMQLFGDTVVSDADILEGFSHDRAFWSAREQPMAMIRVRDTADVQQLARWASRRKVALVPRGAGTGVSGGANATRGCVIVNFERMNRILSVDPMAMLAVVQPGVLNADLKRAAQEVGLWYPPDPSSYEISTLGGNVATNAGGLCCVKYGVTRDYVLGLEAVCSDGTLIRTGGRSRKDVAGYDLTRLLVGSEGTLAMITEITLKLRRQPPASSTLLATFDSLESSGRAVEAIARSADVSLLELMDRATIRAVDAFARLDLDIGAAAMLIAQIDTQATTELSLLRTACEANGASNIMATDDQVEGAQLLNARRLAYPALERLGAVLIDDIAVPLPALPEMLRRIEAVSARTGVMVATVAHAGDGNLHPLIVFDPKDAAAEMQAQEVFTAIMEQALSLQGTITGEHGVGTLKAGFLRRQLSPAVLALHGRIKHAFDADGLLNPGKVFSSVEA
jgi:glycolate oxidase